jgi:phosphoribosylformylglycinamidine synthase
VKYEIRTFLRPGVLDQQGQAVAKALVELGWDNVVSCRIGKVYEIEYYGSRPVSDIAKVVSNEVMENFEIRKVT